MFHRDFGHFCRGDISKYLDFPTSESSVILKCFHLYLGVKLILRRLLVLHNQVVLQYHPLPLRQSFEIKTNLLFEHNVRAIVFHNVTLEHNIAFVLLILRLQLRIFEITDVH